MSRAVWISSLLLLGVFVPSCRIQDALVVDTPPVCVPEIFAFEHPGEVAIPQAWWMEFQAPELNEIVAKVLESNLDLKQAWNRLAQAEALANIESSAKVPDINLIADITRRDSSGPEDVLPSGARTRYLLGGTLSYEVDLWRRINSKANAAWLAADASFEDVEATALLLTGIATDLWFSIQEERELLELFDSQVEINETFLELVELRFSIGDASALDVFQQRLQLSQTQTQIPPAELRLQTARNQLSILMGEPPDAISPLTLPLEKVLLPPFPQIGSPADLLDNRPDLRALQKRIMSADYEVAAAIADRFPKLSVFLSYDFSSNDWKEIFENQLAVITANLLAPLVDGGRRRAEVMRRKTIVLELLHNFGQSFLDALSEVEDAIVQEDYQLKLIEHLERQTTIAEQNLTEARSRYATGLNDYLPVIAAIQSLQIVERRLISEKAFLLKSRSLLYRSLGGYCLADYQPEERIPT